MRRSVLLLVSGLSLVVLSPLPATAQSNSVSRSAPGDVYAEPIAEASQRFGIPAAWIRAVMVTESAGNPRARSSAGARGLMQIMPRTWAALRARHNLGTDPFDPRDNILAGAAYLRELHDRYGAPGFLAAYNAGPGRYEASLNGRPLPAETRAYVAALLPLIAPGAIANPVIVAAVDPLVWARAPLFIAPPGRVSAADPASGKRRLEGDPAAAAVHDVSAIVPLSAGLFVARTLAGDAR
ncbi:lytic transglycosylase domain-containing protein [Mesorhizobium sp. BR1-1-16]|uniref:lytic transglycosylase domain-containing protein n=1 Tax=Mesorhizobium sp. BR1-1-16 TaxID=2876653 RepID=UPI001CCA0775|nr:lytic transglycosylase domain-containing protein [Mesorhizobium sp. BR1-1-16]MBZ9937024.1 lytic transglycosylase domain-containing protein [Mesorhizobium sp. BR1-1-16]